LPQQDNPAAAKLSPNESFAFRVLIAEGLARFPGAEARPALLKLIEDPAPRVRAAATVSLVKVSKANPRDDVVITALVAALEREKLPAIQTAIMESLAAFDRNRVADVLLQTRSGDKKLAATVLKALAAVDVTPESLIVQLNSGEPAQRSQAADRLALLGDPQAVPPLIETLSTARDADIRVSAATALGLLRDRRAVDCLATALHAPEPGVRAASAESLGRIADHTSSEALLGAAKDPEPAVRAAALNSLAILGISVERLSSDLTNPNWQARVAAVSMLARLGDSKSTPLVVAALKDQDSRVRAEAARTLGAIADPGTLDALSTSLRDSNVDVRIESAYALGRLKDSRAISSLTGLLSDRDARVSIAAAESLARMQDPRAIRVLVGSLRDSDWRVRARAAQVLARVAADTPVDAAAAELAHAVTDRDPVVRYYAAEALTGIGANAVAPLMEALRTPRDQDKERAARVLWRIGKPAVEPLIVFVQDRGTSGEMRAVAAHALGVIADPRATEALIQLLRDERYYVRDEAAFALGQMGTGAIDQIIEMSNSGTPSTREAAIQALGHFNSPRAVSRLQEACADHTPAVRLAAVSALGQTGSELAVPLLMTMLRDESNPLRAQAAAALGKLGEPALKSLLECLRDSRPSVRELAAEALGNIGSKKSVPGLLDLIASDQSGARPEAIDALGKIGDPAAVGPILGCMRSGSVAVRKKGVMALARFHDPRAVEALLAALSDHDEDVRQTAAIGLGEIGGNTAILALERTADSDPSHEVRDAAIRSINRIRAIHK
jgi:HEAT repeat protein